MVKKSKSKGGNEKDLHIYLAVHAKNHRNYKEMGNIWLPDQEGWMRSMGTDYRVGSQEWERDLSRAITLYNSTANHLHCGLELVSLEATHYIDDNMNVALWKCWIR